MAGFHHTIHLSIHPTASLSFVPSLWLISVPFFLIPSFVWTSVLSLISSFPAWHHHPSIYPFLTSFPPSGMLLSCDKSVQMNWVKKKKRQKRLKKERTELTGASEMLWMTYRVESFALSPKAFTTTQAANTLLIQYTMHTAGTHCRLGTSSSLIHAY